MPAKFSSRIVTLKLGAALADLGVEVRRSDGSLFPSKEWGIGQIGAIVSGGLQIPRECADIINAWREAVSAKTHPAWKQPAQHSEWADLFEATVLKIAADVWKATRP